MYVICLRTFYDHSTIFSATRGRSKSLRTVREHEQRCSFRNRIEGTSEADDKRYLMAFPLRCLRTIRYVFATCLHIVRENDRSTSCSFFATFEIPYSNSVDYTTNMRDISRYTRTLIKRNFARMSLISRVFATYRLCTRIRPVQSENRTSLTSSSFVYLARRFLFAVRQQ